MSSLKCLHFQNQLNLLLLSRVIDGRKIKKVWRLRQNMLRDFHKFAILCTVFCICKCMDYQNTYTYTTSSIKKKKNKMTLKEIGIDPQGIYDARLCLWCCNYLVRHMIFNLLLCIYFISFGKEIRWPKE